MVYRQFRVLAIAIATWAGVRPAFVLSQQNPTSSGTTQSSPSANKTDEIEIPLTTPDTPAAPVTPARPTLPEIKIPNFASCPLADLQHSVPDLARLKPASDQSPLAAILDKVGARVLEIAGKTPNLISHERVVSDHDGFKRHEDFSYLVVSHLQGPKGRVLDEFRVDLATGEKFETDNLDQPMTPSSSDPSDLPFAVRTLPGVSSAPMSQGYLNDWLHFYPTNRKQSDFRYLGMQHMDGRDALVVAFAQKPSLVSAPGTVQYNGKRVPIFMQGVAWIDRKDFKILRLRCDLLAPPSGVPLRQLTTDIRFAQVRVATMNSPLWLPTSVVVIANLDGDTYREDHTYSKHRLFRAHSKLLLNP